MSVRVVARIRPLLKAEIERDQILNIHDGLKHKPQVVKIPNPKNFSEEYSFQFNSVYGQDSTQQEIFDAEVTPTIKHLFQGFDVTLFAYGVTGTGKTHTMRGGKSLAERGMIPRLLSGIYRKSKSIEKSSEGETRVEVSMSYYEIYNDRVFDLFDAPDKRTATGLPIREAEGGKTVVVGLTEMPCSTLKDFELLYDQANANRSVGATKLNAHSSRSHAILCVKVTIASPTEIRSSTVSAIDLAGSEDNRRTGNGKDRMVESAAINKSLFVLAQCVEAISKKQNRIPYRESKMTRILSLGQNNGFTVMILNLAPTKAYHLDTLSSLNFANRTKKIEVREVENEPMFKGPPRSVSGGVTGGNVQRQPLRPITNNMNPNLTVTRDTNGNQEKPAKLFSVYSDRSRPITSAANRPTIQKSSPLKRGVDSTFQSSIRPPKQSRATPSFIRRGPEAISKATIESMVEQKVSEILATRALNQPTSVPEKELSDEVKARLDLIERRLEGQEGERAEGLSYLFMAKQHQARGENGSALRMYELARPFFEGNEKLERKIEKLRSKLAEKRRKEENVQQEEPVRTGGDDSYYEEADDSDHADEEYSDGDAPRRSNQAMAKSKRTHGSKKAVVRTSYSNLSDGDYDSIDSNAAPTPRTKYLTDVLNSRDVSRLKALNGLGIKKAETIVDFLNQTDEMQELTTWNDILQLEVRGVGKRSWQVMREGISA